MARNTRRYVKNHKIRVKSSELCHKNRRGNKKKSVV